MELSFYFKYYKKIFKVFFTSDRKFFERAYYKKFKTKLNLSQPQNLNEKVIHRILYDRKNIYTELTDKYKVREYIKNKIGKKYLIELYGVYDRVEDISLKDLPKEFVIKCNHDSGSVFICKNINEKEFNQIKNKIKRSLKRNFYYISREWHYKNIVPKILVEKKLNNADDYKFHCFNGKIGLIEFISDRFGDKRINEYDQDWNFLNIETNGCKNTDTLIEKPKNFEKMKEIVEVLSQDFNYVRIDLYNDGGVIKFGEFTFTPASGLDELPEELNIYLGNLWK